MGDVESAGEGTGGDEQPPGLGGGADLAAVGCGDLGEGLAGLVYGRGDGGQDAGFGGEGLRDAGGWSRRGRPGHDPEPRLVTLPVPSAGELKASVAARACWCAAWPVRAGLDSLARRLADSSGAVNREQDLGEAAIASSSDSGSWPALVRHESCGLSSDDARECERRVPTRAGSERRGRPCWRAWRGPGRRRGAAGPQE